MTDKMRDNIRPEDFGIPAEFADRAINYARWFSDQPAIVQIDLGETGILHGARITGAVLIIAKRGEQVSGNIIQPHGGWQPLSISHDGAGG